MFPSSLHVVPSVFDLISVVSSLHLKSEREGVIDDKKVNPIVIENGDFEVDLIYFELIRNLASISLGF